MPRGITEILRHVEAGLPRDPNYGRPVREPTAKLAGNVALSPVQRAAIRLPRQRLKGQPLARTAIRYHADGLDFQGQLFLPSTPGIRPAVLVFPEAFGIGAHSIARAERLAALGFAPLACDLLGEGRFIDDLGEAMNAVQPLFDDPIRTRARATAALQALAARPEVDRDRIAAVGFCFPMPLELARSGAELKAVAGFHTNLVTKLPAKADAIRCSVLACVGADDPFITATDRTGFESEMRAAGAEWQLNVYGNTVHSFTNQDAERLRKPDAIRYSASADTQAWRAMLSLFGQTLS